MRNQSLGSYLLNKVNEPITYKDNIQWGLNLLIKAVFIAISLFLITFSIKLGIILWN